MGGSDAKPPKGGAFGGAGSSQDCPQRIATVIAGPIQGIANGTWLGVRLDTGQGQKRVVLIDPNSGNVVGALAGLPNLAMLMRCLEDGVSYRAHVDKVDGGRIDVTVIRG
jgi:hypothetical protein